LMFHLHHRNFARWYVTNENGRLGSVVNAVAFINSKAMSPNLVDKYSSWSERKHGHRGRFVVNNNLKVTGDCIMEMKPKDEEIKPSKSEGIKLKQGECPGNLESRTIKDKDYAYVH